LKESGVKMNKCPTHNLLNILGKKWTLVIMQELYLNKGIRFNLLLKKFSRLTPKILSQKLKDIEKEGLIIKQVDSSKIKTTKYSLTKKGEEFKAIADSIKSWNAKYFDKKLRCNQIEECIKCQSFR